MEIESRSFYEAAVQDGFAIFGTEKFL